MLTKATLTATLLGFIFLFFGGWLFYEVIAYDYFVDHYVNMTTGIEVNMNHIALGILIQSYALSLLYKRYGKGEYSASNGFKMGAIAGIFVGFGSNLLLLGTTGLMDIEATIIDGFWSIAYFGIAGSLIGFSFKKLG